MPRLSNERRRFLERATLQYQDHLDEAAEYLATRGIDLEFARDVGLGVVRNPESMHSEYEGRLAIPYLTSVGPVQMDFRCMVDHDCKFHGHQKLYRAAGWPTRLYGVQSAQQADDWIAVTEGAQDAMTLQMIGIPAIGVPGSQNFQPHWPAVFEDFSKVYLFADGDDAGDKMLDMWRDRLKEHTAVISARMPDGEDVNSMYVKHGETPLIAKIRR